MLLFFYHATREDMVVGNSGICVHQDIRRLAKAALNKQLSIINMSMSKNATFKFLAGVELRNSDITLMIK